MLRHRSCRAHLLLRGGDAALSRDAAGSGARRAIRWARWNGLRGGGGRRGNGRSGHGCHFERAIQSFGRRRWLAALPGGGAAGGRGSGGRGSGRLRAHRAASGRHAAAADRDGANLLALRGRNLADGWLLSESEQRCSLRVGVPGVTRRCSGRRPQAERSQILRQAGGSRDQIRRLVPVLAFVERPELARLRRRICVPVGRRRIHHRARGSVGALVQAQGLQHGGGLEPGQRAGHAARRGARW